MKKYLIILVTIAFFISCDNDLIDENNVVATNTEASEDIILQERDSSLPPITLFKIKPKTRYGGDFKEVDEYLGYSYDYGESVESSEADAKIPVINIEKLKQKYPSYITPKRLKRTYSWSTAWSGYEKFHKDEMHTRKVNSGFELNLGIFKIGRKKKTTEFFQSVLTTEDRSTIGEVSAEIRHGMFTLQNTDLATKRIAADYVTEDFLDVLYNYSIQTFLNDYGTFVLTSYYTGGRASALYYGISSSSTSEETRTKDMEKNMTASFAWQPTDKDGEAKGDSISGSLNFGRKNGDSTNIQNIGTIDELYFRINTIGGDYKYSISSEIEVVTKVKYDLTTWLESLNDESTHQMINIADNGLEAISSYVLEENFKRRIQDTHLGYLKNRSKLEDPFIEVVKVRAAQAANGESLFDVFAVLNTRHGDKIVLNDGKTNSRSEAELRENMNNDIYLAKATAISKEKRKYFTKDALGGILIKANYSTQIMPLAHEPLCIDLKCIDESNMFKFTNENTEMVYLYDPVNRVAFAYFAYDYIPEAYGMMDWIDNMPEKPISMSTLYQRYTIIGL